MKFFRKAETRKPETPRWKAFRDIYLKGGWDRGDGETASGAGSTLSYTEPLRAALPDLFSELKVRKILDVPCGDFNWFCKIDLGGIRYEGMDIVAEIINANQAKYGTRKIRFSQGDATLDALPKVDLMICRDMLRHLPFADCQAFLKQYLKSGTSWLLVTSYVVKSNTDIDTVMGSRPVNLRVAPFNFPTPSRSIPDWVDGFRERYMCLWSRGEIEKSVQSWN